LIEKKGGNKYQKVFVDKLQVSWYNIYSEREKRIGMGMKGFRQELIPEKAVLGSGFNSHHLHHMGI